MRKSGHLQRTPAVGAGFEVDFKDTLQPRRLTLIETWRASAGSSAVSA